MRLLKAGMGAKKTKGKWIGPYFGGLLTIGASFAAMWATGFFLSRASLPLPDCLRDAVPYLSSVAVGIAVLMILSAVMRGRMLPSGKRPAGGPGVSAAELLTLFFFLSAAGLIAALTSGDLDGSAVRSYRDMSGTDFAVTAVLGTAVYPFAEEALFRRGYLGVLIPPDGPSGTPPAAGVAAVLLQGVLFASVHPQGDRVFAFAAGVALGFGAVAGWRKDGVRFPFVCVLAHGLYNLSQYAAVALWRADAAPALSVMIFITGAAAVALGTVLVIRTRRGKNLPFL